MIEFRINRQSGLPTYAQLIAQVKQALRLGVLQPGDRLPTAKDVVGELAINPNTVLKAYRELEHEGLVAAKPGLGTFVTASLAKAGMAERAALSAELTAWIRRATAAGLERTDLEALAADTLDAEFGPDTGVST